MGISDDIKPRRALPVYVPDIFNEKKVTPPGKTKGKPILPEPNNEAQIEEISKESNIKTPTDEIENSAAAHSKLENQFFEEKPSSSQKNQVNLHQEKSKGFWVIIVWFLIFIAAGTFATYQGITKIKRIKEASSGEDKSAGKNNENKYYAGEVATQDKLTDSGQAQSENQPATETSTTTAATGTESKPAGSLTTPTSKENISIKVLNGNGVTNSAQKVKSQLVEAGFNVDSVANARRFTYAKTYIYHKSDKENEANLVKEALSDRETILEVSDEVTKGTDIIVVVGKK